MPLDVTRISNKSIYQLMFHGCFIALEYQYLNLRVELFFFFFPPHRHECAREARLPNRNKHRHLVFFAADARGRAVRGCGRGWKTLWKENARRLLAVHQHCHPQRLVSSSALSFPYLVRSQQTDAHEKPQKSSSRHKHLGSIAFWDCSQKHLYPPHSLCSLSVSLYSC